MFKFGGSEILLSALVMRYVSRKSTLNMKNGKQLLQVTTIKKPSLKKKNPSKDLISQAVPPSPASYGFDRSNY